MIDFSQKNEKDTGFFIDNMSLVTNLNNSHDHLEDWGIRLIIRD
jgi:hypothetical protein